MKGSTPESLKPQKPSTSASEVKPRLRSRYIPQKLRREVFQKSDAGCAYVDPLSKRACGAQSFLQIDHIHPFALGGGHRPENLRLLCSSHNQWRATKTLNSPNLRRAQPNNPK